MREVPGAKIKTPGFSRCPFGTKERGGRLFRQR